MVRVGVSVRYGRGCNCFVSVLGVCLYLCLYVSLSMSRHVYLPCVRVRSLRASQHSCVTERKSVRHMSGDVYLSCGYGLTQTYMSGVCVCVG